MQEEIRFLSQSPELVVSQVDASDENAASTDSRTVRGYGAVFNSQSEDLGFREILAPGSITNDTIANSDVFARFNHDSSKILARCNHGTGSLKLSVDDRGLAYEFEAPKTAAGDELLEALRRGDISQSSFAFTVREEDEEWKFVDGKLLRTIFKIDKLYDVAPVYQPAYSATECNARTIERAQSHINRKTTLLGKLESLQEKVNENDTEGLAYCDELRKVYDNCVAECRDLNPDEQKLEQRIKTIIENKKTFEQQQQQEAEARAKVESNNSKKSNMTKKVTMSILPAILAVMEGRSLSAEQKAVNDFGREMSLRSGIAPVGQIFIPTESRALTIADEGSDIVGIEVQDILSHAYGKTVLAEAGARFIPGLQNDLQFPILSGAATAWAGENGSQAADSALTSAKLSPHRLTTYVDVSMQFLRQATPAAESILQQDLTNAILAKLEATILGNASGKTGETRMAPEGIFYLASGTLPAVSTFAGITDLESRVDDSNVSGECKYIVSNKAKAILRNLSKSTKSTQLVMEGGEVDGTPVLATSNVAGAGIAYGDWSRLVIGQWGALDVTVDAISQAYVGNVRLVVNSYFDAAVLGDVNKATTGAGVIAVATASAS